LETTIVICLTTIDFQEYMRSGYGVYAPLNNRRVYINNRLFLCVTSPTHLIGHRCDTIVSTRIALHNQHYNEINEVAHTFCLVRKKNFKFGR